ncbi:MAG TPA: DNA polymerase IV [Acidimicrobiales bacterium]|nr:DNA polymerase IV [Acidimicrobiales bacterium]
MDEHHRVILHVDMDAFFASVEVLDDPSLAGRPVIVGGSGGRGVVAACTYEARMFGVHSAMPSSVARRLCPEAVFVDGRHHRYSEESAKLHAILESVTPLVEGISIDEAFLDVTGSVRLLGPGPVIARDIRGRVADELHLTCSVGVAPSKLMAKLASKAAKPRADRSGIRPGAGIVVVEPGRELEFLHPLPIEALWGVGPVSARRLRGLGIMTVGDLASLPPGSLERQLGKAQGSHLAELCRGVDDRPVVPDQKAKSIGHEETFPSDLWDPVVIQGHLTRIVDAAASHLRGSDLGARTITVKIKFGDFTMITRSHSMVTPVDSAPAVGAIASALLESVDLAKGIRLLGVSLSGFGATGANEQLSWDLGVGGPSDTRMMRAGEEAERLQLSWGGISAAVDSIRARYGQASVGSASMVEPDGLRVRRRGDAPWGPTAEPKMEDTQP